MTEFKCKICGGTLALDEGSTIAECEYCGTKQTLPKLTDDRRNSLYDRANHYRRNNEFDKAAGIYEQLLNEDTTDAEAYWSLVLCRYGIEYVEDPSSHKRLPTINRAQYTSIFADENYKSALQYANGGQRALYEEEAAVIDNIQKGILAISAKEEPFDVFICYKETDTNGRRTRDSALATELYQELTREGLKTFFARVTLEDKLGEAYEPYIFAALNSAKVMVVVGTKPEHLQAVWVKNEWSRYLGLIKAGARKTLIPAYKDMDPYDMPDEFSHLQALDMSKLGFMQDLIRGIKKLTAADEKPAAIIKETTVISNNSGISSAEPMVKRAFLSLEDSEFEKADEFAEQALNIDPEYSLAYVAKLMSQLEVKTRDGLGKLEKSFEDNGNYKKAVRFGDASIKKELAGYLEEIMQRIELNYKNSVYTEACNLMSITVISSNEKAINLFKSLDGFKDSESKIHECEINIKQILAKQEQERIEAERRAEEETQRRDDAIRKQLESIMADMVKCKAGTFMMGSPCGNGLLGFLGLGGEFGRLKDETMHQVIISQDFYISKFPVTQSLYKSIIGDNPSRFCDDNCPVENIDWNMAKEFCQKLNAKTDDFRIIGYHFDLPTEAQWEYACRAGSITSLNNGKDITFIDLQCSNLDEVGWYRHNSENKTHPVGQKKPNAWGIYDMHGNVWEWCDDWYNEYPSASVTDPVGPDSGVCCVSRGGSFDEVPQYCRSAARKHNYPGYRRYSLGFRVALVPDTK